MSFELLRYVNNSKGKFFFIANETEYASYIISSAALYELSFVFESRTDHAGRENKVI